MKTVWLLYEYRDCGPDMIPDYKGIFATKAAAEAFREEAAESQRIAARADGWEDDDPFALHWWIQEYEVNE